MGRGLKEDAFQFWLEEADLAGDQVAMILIDGDAIGLAHAARNGRAKGLSGIENLSTGLLRDGDYLLAHGREGDVSGDTGKTEPMQDGVADLKIRDGFIKEWKRKGEDDALAV